MRIGGVFRWVELIVYKSTNIANKCLYIASMPRNVAGMAFYIASKHSNVVKYQIRALIPMLTREIS